ncbi:MAG: septal ring lytic transglycosylase RlpA family protein [Deltaproteobacteria bacterium]|nr:septal ring lytic transglycosylase RlpA family protein [Deltaproteobacteria bacterium]
MIAMNYNKIRSSRRRLVTPVVLAAMLVVWIFFTWGCAGKEKRISRRPVAPSQSGEKPRSDTDSEVKSEPTPGGKPYVVLGKTYYPLTSAAGFEETGVASWYGGYFHGRRTSNGEIYNMYGHTAAHKLLPLGVVVEVTNLENGRKTRVRVNDRGPFVKNRVIDLSYATAKELGVDTNGTAKVRLVALGIPTKITENGKERTVYVQPKSYTTGDFTVQIGAFKDFQNALNLRRRFLGTYPDSHISEYDNGLETFYRVRVSLNHTVADAEHTQRDLARLGYKDTFIVAK